MKLTILSRLSYIYYFAAFYLGFCIYWIILNIIISYSVFLLTCPLHKYAHFICISFLLSLERSRQLFLFLILLSRFQVFWSSICPLHFTNTNLAVIIFLYSVLCNSQLLFTAQYWWILFHCLFFSRNVSIDICSKCYALYIVINLIPIFEFFSCLVYEELRIFLHGYYFCIYAFNHSPAVEFNFQNFLSIFFQIFFFDLFLRFIWFCWVFFQYS